jgi:hypothetical protein
MNTGQFNQWLDYHEASFPGTKAKLNQGGEDAHWAWAKSLDDVDLVSAKKATDAMLRGDVIGRVYHSDIPKTIRQTAAQFQAREHCIVQPAQGQVRQCTVDENGYRHYTDNCTACRDSGLREVWCPSAINAMRAGEFAENRRAWRTESVRCSCGAGAEWKLTRAEFDATIMCEVINGSHREDDHARLRAFVDDKAETDPFNLSGHTYPGASTGATT